MLGFSSNDLTIEPVVEVVSRGSVVEETKGRKSDETSHIEWSSTDEDLHEVFGNTLKLAIPKFLINHLLTPIRKTYLSQEVTKGPTNKRSECLRCQRVLVKRVVVGGPSWNGSSTNLSWVTEERALNSGVLAECRFDGASKVLVYRRAW